VFATIAAAGGAKKLPMSLFDGGPNIARRAFRI
jgi:hypothetical protein